MLSREEAISRIKHKTIKILGEYERTEAKIKVKCLNCKFVWITTIRNLFRHGCTRCFENKRLTNKDIDKKLKGKNIQRLEDYKNSTTPIKFKCSKKNCGHEWKTCANKITTQNTGCPKCCNHVELSNEIVDERIKGRYIKRIGSYKGCDTPIKFICLNNKCNNVWKATPYHIIQRNHGCPECSTGKSEKIIKELIYKHVKYNFFKHHKPFYFNNRKYVPDFYLEVNNKKIIIEYNGHQHYKPVNFGGISQYRANKNFIKQQQRDKELRKYCKTNKIKLVEIPFYWKEEKIIKLFLSL